MCSHIVPDVGFQISSSVYMTALRLNSYFHPSQALGSVNIGNDGVVMEGLSDCLEFVHSTWLATSISSCFSKPQDGEDKPEPAAPGTCVSPTIDQL